MPQGLQIWDAAGNLTLQVSDRLARILGIVQTGAVDGSIAHAGFLTGTPFFIQRATQTGGAMPAKIGIDGATLSWSYSGGAPVKLNTMIIYGVY